MAPMQLVDHSYKLDQIIPIGRNAAEYLRMFNLYNIHESRSFIDCGAGPSCFNAQMTEQGKQVVSIDPLYQFNDAQIKQRINDTFPELIEKIHHNKHLFRWDYFNGVEELMESRSQTMKLFLADYEQGKSTGRYQSASLPKLPFGDNAFDIALSSHLLFLYSSTLDAEFHYQAILEMMRVAKETRIFPLIDQTGEVSPWLRDTVRRVLEAGFHTQLVNVPYEFQKGANQCLIIRKPFSIVNP